MPGFACIISNSETIPPLELHHQCQSPTRIENIINRNFNIYRFVLTKFANDKIFTEDDDVIIALEGVILNFQKLKTDHGCRDYFTTAKRLYQNLGDKFFKAFRGEFSGLLYDKKKKHWLFFTNHTGTKPVFYYHNESVVICASELQLVTQLLRKLNYHYSLDEIGCYFLLTFGFMLEDYTLFKEIKKLKPGHYIKYRGNQLDVDGYHLFDNATIVNHSQDDLIENLDTLFKNAVTLEYEKDREYGYKHLATLSGGLDSRMNIMTAHELHYQNIFDITFSQSNFLDEIIAKNIASDLGHGFLFYALDNGNYLINIVHDAVMANGGLALYSGAAHALALYKTLSFSDVGLIHTGQLGDAVLGSYLSEPRRIKPKPFVGAYSENLSDKISTTVNRIARNYQSEEIFKFYNRGFNGVVNGNWMANQFTEICSPFLDVDFFEYALSIPPELKYKEMIYQKWIIKKRPLAVNYIWEKTREKITANKMKLRANQFCRRLRNKVFGRPSVNSMNPFDYWHRTNPHLRKYIENYKNENINILDGYSELKTDCLALFQSERFIEKTQAMTLLEALKQHK